MGTQATPRIALDIARASGLALAGYLDVGANAEPPNRALQRLGDENRLSDPEFIGAHDLFITAADPERRELAGMIGAQGGRVSTLIHPSSTIASTASLGEGTLISAACVVGVDAQIGRFCTLHSACTMDHDDVLEDWVTIAPGAHLAGWVRCGEGAYIGIGAAGDRPRPHRRTRGDRRRRGRHSPCSACDHRRGEPGKGTRAEAKSLKIETLAPYSHSIVPGGLLVTS